MEYNTLNNYMTNNPVISLPKAAEILNQFIPIANYFMERIDKNIIKEAPFTEYPFYSVEGQYSIIYNWDKKCWVLFCGDTQTALENVIYNYYYIDGKVVFEQATS